MLRVIMRLAKSDTKPQFNSPFVRISSWALPTLPTDIEYNTLAGRYSSNLYPKKEDRTVTGPSPNGSYDLTTSSDNFSMSPGLLAGLPNGLLALDGNDTVRGSADPETMFG